MLLTEGIENVNKKIKKGKGVTKEVVAQRQEMVSNK